MTADRRRANPLATRLAEPTTDPRKLQRAVSRTDLAYARACEARNNWLIDRINDGWTHQQISDALGVSRGRVAAILKSSQKSVLEQREKES